MSTSRQLTITAEDLEVLRRVREEMESLDRQVDHEFGTASPYKPCKELVELDALIARLTDQPTGDA